MAVDKLVDSTQLDADLTSVANAIRTKGGTSAQMAFPAGFVSAVEAIPTGGSDPGDWTAITRMMTSIIIAENPYTKPEEIIIDAGMATTIRIKGGWTDAGGCKTLTILNTNRVLDDFSIGLFCYNGQKPVTLNVLDGIKPKSCIAMFDYQTQLKYVNGVIDFSAVTSGNGLSNILRSLTNLIEIRFAPNSAKYDNWTCWRFQSNSLSDESLVSIVNLPDESVSYSLNLTASAIARLDAMMGTSTLDQTGTYHIFTPDSSGAISASEFVTTVKGWTLATM